ncbi:phosphocholine-specific phospholipase C [Paracidovorax avenae]|uniref:phosphocholine-specific phospholipase C n=1 Tax=Paracidovorax avenae TaxID=80867 RepID=UPI0006B3BE7D|nr:phospholipase C, phosphocholine-specific [Paracidovorax avenae]
MTLDASKRKFLQSAAGTTAGAAALSLFPPSIRRALAIPAHQRTGTIMDVEHVVIVMQENRSFDHYFGTLAGVRGFGDRFTIPLPGNRSVWQQFDQNGQPVLPYHLDQAAGNAQRVDGTPHSWVDARDAWDRGRMSEWPRYKQLQSMGYYMQTELSFQFALANAFTVCDAYFCSLHGGTNTNRLFHMTGTNGATGPSGQVVVDNAWDALDSATDIRSGGYDWTTYPERLQQAGVSWMVYQNMPDNFTDNPLIGFRRYRQANLASGKPVYIDRDANPAYDPARDDASNPLYKGIANTMPDGGLLGTFRQAVQNGTLPQVSWIIPPAEYSEHPNPSSPVQGGWYVQEVLDALTANPDVWSKTVLLVNFDENDGYFDHVPPPCAPSLDGRGGMLGKSTLAAGDMAYEYYTHMPYAGTDMPPPDGDCYGPGPRVPMWVISPWSRGGWVNSQNFDHTSVLRFLEARFGVKEPQISPYRRAVFGDLTSAFNFATPNDAPLATLAGRRSKADADALRTAQDGLPQIAVPSPQALPRQETGTRPSRALPYELHTSACIDVAGGTVQLLFSNTGTAAAVFHVYDRLHLDRAPRRYVVEAGKRLDDRWSAGADGGAYDLWVLGPNGFHRGFTGKLAALRGAVPNPEVRVFYDAANGNVCFALMNQGAATAMLQMKANAYRSDGPWSAMVAPGQSQDLQCDLSGSAHWYDFTVTCDALPGFSRRFAGRVETGLDGLSDPAMGLAGASVRPAS